MTPTALIGCVSSVVPHPNSDKLDIVSINEFTNVANRLDDGSPRYKVGDFAVVLTENLILPTDVIKFLHMWDETKNKGYLAGSKGNRTKARNIADVPSQVALCKIEWKRDEDSESQEPCMIVETGLISIPELGVSHAISKNVHICEPEREDISPVGIDMMEILNIKVYVPAA